MPHDSVPNGRDDRDAPPDTTAVAAFLRVLATRVEGDSGFARQVQEALQASGLHAPPKTPGTRSRRRRDRPSGAASGTPAVSPPARASAAPLPDPFQVLRVEGEAGLHAQLAGLEVSALRQIVRIHRLDPARISARWTNRERLVLLIVQQARARADHGKAFTRV
jgi:hypothetical protein